MNRMRCVIGLSAVVALSCAVPAKANFLGSVARGLSLFDFQFAGERNVLGDGYNVNAVASYNNRTFDFGPAELTLSGAVRLSGGYTTRGLPRFNFAATTLGTPLSYTLDFNNGIQEYTATGSVLVNIDTKINALGFYDQTFQISNRGTADISGFLLVDEESLDSDIGPIVISGNIYVDAIAALTEPFFTATGTTNPFVKITGKATKTAELNKTADDLRARLAAGESLSGDEMGVLVNNTIMAALLGGQPSGNLFDGLLVPDGLLSENGTPAYDVTLLPEPSTLILLLGGAVTLLRRRT